MPGDLEKLRRVQREHVGDVPGVAVAGLDPDGIDEHQLREAGRRHHRELGRRPAAHREPHQDGVLEVERVDEIEVQELQVVDVVEVIGDPGARETGMDRGHDVEFLRQPGREGHRRDRPAAAMEHEQRLSAAAAHIRQLDPLQRYRFHVVVRHCRSSSISSSFIMHGAVGPARGCDP